MIHDPGHIEPPATSEPIVFSAKEKEVLGKLGEKYAYYGSLPVNQEREKLWTKMNDLDSERPMVWINEIPWHEMNHNEELTIETEHPFAQLIEGQLRRDIYQWEHMQADMIIYPKILCPKAIHSTDFGIVEKVDIVKTDDKSDIVSRHFNKQIHDYDDLEKIKMPEITHNETATQYRMEALEDAFEGILPVEAYGQSHIWFTPWDYLIRWWGIEDAMMDLVLRPDMVNAFVSRMVDAWMYELDQFAELNLLELDNNNTRIGSGGYGYTGKLPSKDYDGRHVRPIDMWGCSNAQIFTNVSPEMHWEFAIEHDMRWLERWGMTYYGCCEPLDSKLHLLDRIPNLRKISFSPWCDNKKMIDNVGDKWVLSRKPNPAIFAGKSWDPQKARQDIREILDIAEGRSHIEFVMKDISTVSYQPQKLWEWADIAMEEVQNYSSK